MVKAEIEKLVPDTSVVIEGLLSKKIENKEIKVQEVVIHEAVLAELEHQANIGKASGFLGLDEIKKIRQLSEKDGFTLTFAGKRPAAAEIKYASLGEIDALIRQLAWELDATLITSDKIQSRVAEARGIKNILIVVERETKVLALEKFFDEQTMSVHLREDLLPYAKKGMPGAWQFVPIGEMPLTQQDVRAISKQIIEEARVRLDGFIEIEREGSLIIQLGVYRIVITKPPFSDGWEITAVRPIKSLGLEDYNLSEKLRQRLEKAEGILIAGAPGMGKSTFAQALALHYASKKKIVKTVEAPRDLQLGPSITQYSLTKGTFEEIHDVLLLSRPDYTVYDEMRNTPDFKLFTDLRLAGVGMVGVIHATQPIDAIHRFVGRIELGVIPHVVDTVIFIKNGKIHKVLSLKMVVKVPSGMTEADLARPLVEVTDFETGKPEFEIYTYGEETVVIPTQEGEVKSPALEIAAKTIEERFKRFSPDIKVEVISGSKAVVYVPYDLIPKIIGKKGEHISAIEKEIGISIDVKELEAPKKSIQYDIDVGKRDITFYLNKNMANRDIDIYIDGEFITTVKASKKAIIKISKESELGRKISSRLNRVRLC